MVICEGSYVTRNVYIYLRKKIRSRKFFGRNMRNLDNV